jgi:hypothetical protein
VTNRMRRRKGVVLVAYGGCTNCQLLVLESSALELVRHGMRQQPAI